RALEIAHRCVGGDRAGCRPAPGATMAHGWAPAAAPRPRLFRPVSGGGEAVVTRAGGGSGTEPADAWSLSHPYGWRARLGLIVPPTNTVNEAEWRIMAPEGVTIHSARMP